MGIPKQNQLFSWKDADSIGDLERLILVLKYLPDEKLIDLLIEKRDKGRDDRTAVERVNSRIDLSFGFEQHYIRGEAKMRTRCGLALCIMLAMAYGRIMENQKELSRSLVKAA